MRTIAIALSLLLVAGTASAQIVQPCCRLITETMPTLSESPLRPEIEEMPSMRIMMEGTHIPFQISKYNLLQKIAWDCWESHKQRFFACMNTELEQRGELINVQPF